MTGRKDVATIRGAISKALDAILGPGSDELGEALADRVRYFRWRSAVSIMERAKQFAEKKNIKPREVPLNFLVPFIDQASLVEDGSEIADMWANLLVSSMTDYSAEMVAYTKILSELTPRGSAILKYLMNQEKGPKSRLVHPEGVWSHDIQEIITTEYDLLDPENSDQQVFAALKLNGFSLLGFGVEFDERMFTYTTEFEMKVVTNHGYNSLDLLRRQGLVDLIRIPWTDAGQFSFTATAALVTSLGLDFYSKCTGLEDRWVPDAKKKVVKVRGEMRPAKSRNKADQRKRTQRDT